MKSQHKVAMNPRVVEWLCTFLTLAGFILALITQTTVGITIGVVVCVISSVTMWRLSRSGR